MGKTKLLLPLLMAIVMMAMSPQKLWAQDVYISHIKIGASNNKSGDDGKKEARGYLNGWTILDDKNGGLDMNSGNGGAYVYLGYRTTTDVSQAIREIIIVDAGSEYQSYLGGHREDENGTNSYITIDGKKFYRAFAAGSANLNHKGNQTLALTLYYTRDGNHAPINMISIWDTWNSSGYSYVPRYCLSNGSWVKDTSDSGTSTSYPNTGATCRHIVTHSHSYGSNGVCSSLYNTNRECHGKPCTAGTGTASSPYQIANAGNLMWFAEKVNGANEYADGYRTTATFGTSAVSDACSSVTYKDQSAHAKLINDIDYHYAQLTTSNALIGNGSSNAYKGTFNGNNKTVSVWINVSGEYNYPALFSYANGATIKNLCVSGNVITGNKFAAGVCGRTEGSAVTFTNVHSNVEINSGTSGDGTHGGMVGVAAVAGSFTNCLVTAKFTSHGSTTTDYWGGFIGWAENTNQTFSNCYLNLNSASNNGTTGSNLVARNMSTISGVSYSNTSASHFATAQGTSIDASQFTTGEVAYKLNGSTSGTTWRQNITSGTVDNNPVLDQTHGNVYNTKHYNCAGTRVHNYTNSSTSYTDAHSYTSQTVSDTYKKSDATCTAAAVYYYSCSKCNANENNANHTFTNGSAIGHGSTGYTETYSWSGTCYNDASKDTKACSFTLKCNKCSTNVVNGSSLTCSKTAHTDATCLAAGKTTYSATGSYTSTNSSYNYSATKTHDYTIAALGHGSTGYTETYTWSGTCYNDASQDTKACTFTLKCKMCSTNVVEGTSLTCTKKAHTDATCTKTGSTTYCATGSYTSANVSYNYSATKTNDYTVAAIGHKYTTYTYNNDVTCGKAGTKTASCDNGCGTTDTKDDPEHPATGSHEFTENSNGFCTGCGIYQPATLVNSVYEIGNAGQLYWFANQANTVNLGIHGKLTKDITVNDGTFDENGKFTKTGETVESTPISWTPIGSNSYSPYTGTFDGNNHSISGLYCSRPTRGYVGFFGCAKGATITDLGIIKSYFCGYLNVGAVCGSIYSTNANITNCFSADGFIRGSYNGENSGGIGGLVGLCGNGNPTISNCHSSCTVISDCEKTGGLCGWNSGTLVGCYATGNVTGTLYRVGGICGYNKGGIIKRSWFSGNVSDAKGAVAGICGELGSGTIENCFVTGNVIDISTTTSQYETDYGGIVAWIVDGNVTNCYFTGNITCVNKTDQTLIGGICGCEDEGYISNCYTNYNIGVGGYSGTINNVNANVPLARFQSGEIAYLLNGSRNEDTEESPLVWGQVLEADTTPTLNGHGVHSYKRTNIKNKWGTLVVPFDVLADQEEYDLYSIIRVEDEELALERPEGILPAGTPVLVRMSEAGKDAETGKYNLILKAANTTLNTSGTLTSEIVEGLTLKGSYDVKDITKVSGYIISNNAFWNIQTIKGENKIYNAPFRAYLEGSTANCAKMLSIGWNDDEDITAVETLDALTSDEAQYFDINGRRLNDLQQGINIVKRGNKTYKIIVK